MDNTAAIEKTDSAARITAILLAAGKGTRMGGSIRKQFMELSGKPVLMWPLEALVNSTVVTDIVLVVPNGTPEEISAYRKYIEEEFLAPLGGKASKVRALVPGGKERYNSVYNGIEAITWDCDYVFIHDGARPMLTEEMLLKLASATAQYHAVVAASPSKDTVKITDDEGYVASTPDRAHVWNIATPQCFDYPLVRDAYRKVVGSGTGDGSVSHSVIPEAPRPKITDDAMVVEYAASTKVRPIDTGYRNIKITTPEDILIAEAFLAAAESSGNN